MKITILCSSPDHPVNPYLYEWMDVNRREHEILIARNSHDLNHGDILFLISCHEILPKYVRMKFTKCLVIHASDLPEGKGWSPHTWAIIEGETSIVMTLLEASDKIDSGAIWKKSRVTIPNHALFDEINEFIFRTELSLMDFAIKHFYEIEPVPQIDDDTMSSFYRKRIPVDSQIDPHKSIAEQFDVIRVSDVDRYPAFFELRGFRYKIHLEKIK